MEGAASGGREDTNFVGRPGGRNSEIRDAWSKMSSNASGFPREDRVFEREPAGDPPDRISII